MVVWCCVVDCGGCGVVVECGGVVCGGLWWLWGGGGV